MEANYFIKLWWVFFLPYIDMNQPRAYMCPLSQTPLPPPSLFHPSVLSQCTRFECPVSCIKFELVIYFTYGKIHVSMLFSQIIPPLPSPNRVQKSILYICVSFTVSHIGYHYHLSKLHIYALLYCIGVFFF